jgi:Domain of unknown function (DUF5615)
MPRTIRFHLDENRSRAIALGLRNRGIDATTTPEAGLLHAPDERQLAYGLLEGRVIFTQDRDFLHMHAAGTAHRGIAYCKKNTLGVGKVIEGLVLIWEIHEPEDMENRVEYL